MMLKTGVITNIAVHTHTRAYERDESLSGRLCVAEAIIVFTSPFLAGAGRLCK